MDTTDMPSDCTARSLTTCPSSMTLDSLPMEVLNEIAGQFHDGEDEYSDLGSLRATCRRLRAATTPTYFRTVNIRPILPDEGYSVGSDDESGEGWHDIALDDHLRFHVRYVIIEFERYIHDAPQLLDYFRLKFPAGSRTLRRHFPNVRSINLRLPVNIRGTKPVVHKVLTAVSALVACDPESLTISYINLLKEYAADEPLLKVDDFRPEGKSKATLRRLHLSFSSCPANLLVFSPVPGDSFHEKRFWDGVPAKLRRDWLKPSSSSLTHLSLYSPNYWGAFPPVDFQKLKFPHLRSLALGNYCFAYPYQLDSILALETLESLLLDDCPILLLAMLYNGAVKKLDVDTTAWESVPSMCSAAYKIYAPRVCWKNYFQRMAKSLPRLRRFGFRPGDWSWNSSSYNAAMEQHNEFSVDWRPQSRYVAFSAARHRWLEIMTRPKDADEKPVEDKFFRVDMDKELNWRLREAFSEYVQGDVPQVTETMIEEDEVALRELVRVVEERARKRDGDFEAIPRLEAEV